MRHQFGMCGMVWSGLLTVVPFIPSTNRVSRMPEVAHFNMDASIAFACTGQAPYVSSVVARTVSACLSQVSAQRNVYVCVCCKHVHTVRAMCACVRACLNVCCIFLHRARAICLCVCCRPCTAQGQCVSACVRAYVRAFVRVYMCVGHLHRARAMSAGSTSSRSLPSETTLPKLLAMVVADRPMLE